MSAIPRVEAYSPALAGFLLELLQTLSNRVRQVPARPPCRSRVREEKSLLLWP